MKNTLLSLYLFSFFSLFAENKEPPVFGYNAPAYPRKGCWDIYGEALFNYWKPTQDNMELGSKAVLGAVVTIGANSAFAEVDQTAINLNSGYHPGFQIALGSHLGTDNWDLKANYIWFHSQDSIAVSVIGTSPAEVIFPMQDPLKESIFIALVEETLYRSASETWKLHIDIADLQLARAEYVGKYLVFQPFVALRGALISQKLKANYYFENTAALTSDVLSLSRSWALGPRIGLKTDWFLRGNLRLTASVGGDILHTCYTKIRHSSSSQGSELVDSIALFRIASEFKEDHSIYNRAHLDLDLGFKWGTFLAGEQYHIDLMATYGFQAFFNQNMFRHLEDDIVSALSISPNGNLYIEGLTLLMRLDY